MTYFIKINKVSGGYKADGFSRVFKRVSDLKRYFERTSSAKVKFIKNY